MEGDLPPPAYSGPAEAPAPTEADFVAPRAPAIGDASQEMRARLQSAAQGAPRPRAPKPAPAAEKTSRFANIGGFLGKMTGQPEEEAKRPRPEPRRAQAVEAAPVAYDEDYDSDPDSDRIEIPAFLRRQAN